VTKQTSAEPIHSFKIMTYVIRFKYFTICAFLILVNTNIAAQTNYKSDKLNQKDPTFPLVIEDCDYSYKQLDNLLQFFYRFEGNLPVINENKLKRLEYISKELKNLKSPNRKSLFDEVYLDADYYQFKISEKANQIIKQVEHFKKNSSVKINIEQVSKLPSIESPFLWENPYKRIDFLVDLTFDIYDFYSELEITQSEFSQLKQSDRLAKSIENDARKFAIEKHQNRTVFKDVISCHTSLLNRRTISKWLN
jgi:hypothetical protein